jgi:hypothetical protein
MGGLHFAPRSGLVKNLYLRECLSLLAGAMNDTLSLSKWHSWHVALYWHKD